VAWCRASGVKTLHILIKWAAFVQSTDVFDVKCDGALPNVRGFINTVITSYMHVGLLSAFGENSRDLDGVLRVPSFG
jgi:hypothetical protein